MRIKRHYQDYSKRLCSDVMCTTHSTVFYPDTL